MRAMAGRTITLMDKFRTTVEALRWASLNQALEPDWPMVSRDIGRRLAKPLEATGSVRHPLHDAFLASGSTDRGTGELKA